MLWISGEQHVTYFDCSELSTFIEKSHVNRVFLVWQLFQSRQSTIDIYSSLNLEVTQNSIGL